jgi:hypothetical protein
MDRCAALLCLLCALCYAATGIAFFFDPTSQLRPGTLDYWAMLATAPIGRQAFLMAFACAGITAFCAMTELQRLIGQDSGFARIAGSLGKLGFGVTAITYVRLLGGEPQRAQAYAAGSEDVRQSITSFSLSLDPQGWIIFFVSGLSLLMLGGLGWRRGTIPKWLALLGTAAGLLYIVAFAARLNQQMIIVDIAAGLGGVIVGPLWWLGLARQFAKREIQDSATR